ncbi:MAG: inorganic phosphate transporter [Actinomycetota bacterium]|nr:inorganic phosphate transporter [Actinomycetota bacterium]
MTLLLIAVAAGFAFSMGAHYTGACMGMPHALGAASERRALWTMAPLALLGATFASHRVEVTVGRHLLLGAGLSTVGLVIVIGAAFALTSVFNKVRVPTSTIQILVASVIGAGLAAGARVNWPMVAALGVVWVAAPVVAGLLGYLATIALDHTRLGHTVSKGASATALPAVGATLMGVGALASFTMGGNDVANATGSLVATGTLSLLAAGALGGVFMALGVLTWGRPLLRRIAFEIVEVDTSMATAAQLVQALVVLSAVAFGFFTSMNQALVGAMTGSAMARGKEVVHRRTLTGILRGWLIGPGAGAASAFAAAHLVAALGLARLLAG